MKSRATRRRKGRAQLAVLCCSVMVSPALAQDSSTTAGTSMAQVNPYTIPTVQPHAPVAVVADQKPQRLGGNTTPLVQPKALPKLSGEIVVAVPESTNLAPEPAIGVLGSEDHGSPAVTSQGWPTAESNTAMRSAGILPTRPASARMKRPIEATPIGAGMNTVHDPSAIWGSQTVLGSPLVDESAESLELNLPQLPAPTTSDLAKPKRLPTIIFPTDETGVVSTEDKIVASPASHPTRLAPVPEDQRVIDPTIPEKHLSSVRWLPSQSTLSQQRMTAQLLQSAESEYRRGAQASAEQSLWAALESAASAFDIADRRTQSSEERRVITMASELQLARTAMREARDFSGKYGFVDYDGVRRIVRSHQSTVMKELKDRDIAARDAIDLYMNAARVRLSRLATGSVQAAQAMDLMASVLLARGGEHRLSEETALTLRRAALQGQPSNGSLALQLGKHLNHLGLDAEAKWALGHSMKLAPSAEAGQLLAEVTARSGQRETAMQLLKDVREQFPDEMLAAEKPVVPMITQLTPAQFAATSQKRFPDVPASSPKAEMGLGQATPVTPRPVAVSPVGYQGQVNEPGTSAKKASAPRRFFESIKRAF